MKVNLGSQNADKATITMMVPFDAADLQRARRACEFVAAQKGEPFTLHDLICLAVTLAVQDIEAGYPKADDASGDAVPEGLA